MLGLLLAAELVVVVVGRGGDNECGDGRGDGDGGGGGGGGGRCLPLKCQLISSSVMTSLITAASTADRFQPWEG